MQTSVVQSDQRLTKLKRKSVLPHLEMAVLFGAIRVIPTLRLTS